MSSTREKEKLDTRIAVLTVLSPNIRYRATFRYSESSLDNNLSMHGLIDN